MHYLIDLAELQSSGWSDKAGIQYFNQSLRTPTNLGRSLTCFQTGLETLNGEWMYLPGQVERTVVRRQCSLLLVWYWGMALSHPPHNQSYHFLVLGKLNPVFPFLMLMLDSFWVVFRWQKMSAINETVLVIIAVYALPSSMDHCHWNRS